MEQISDMYFAAALLAYGLEFEETKVDVCGNRKQVFFVFQDKGMKIHKLDDGEIREVELDIPSCYNVFQSKKMMFTPDYPDCIRSIKSAIYNAIK